MAFSLSTNMNFNVSFDLRIDNVSGGLISVISSLYYTIIV